MVFRVGNTICLLDECVVSGAQKIITKRILAPARIEAKIRIMCEKHRAAAKRAAVYFTAKVAADVGIIGCRPAALVQASRYRVCRGSGSQDVHDLGLTIHAHPTLSETVAFAAEMITGSITDLYIKK